MRGHPISNFYLIFLTKAVEAKRVFTSTLKTPAVHITVKLNIFFYTIKNSETLGSAHAENLSLLVH